MSTGPHQRGFTLLELIIAIGIFGLVSVMAYGGLASVLRGSEVNRDNSEQLAAMQTAFLVVQKDIQHAVPRKIRDTLGSELPAMQGGAGAIPVLEFTRGGWPNPAGDNISDMKRIAYEVRDDTLYRLTWPVLDRVQDSAPLAYPLLTAVDTIELRFMDAGNNWQSSWPAPNASLPLAVEIEVRFTNNTTARRLFRVQW